MDWRAKYSDMVDSLISKCDNDSPPSIKSLNDILNKVGKECELKNVKRKRQDWFTINKDKLFQKIYLRNKAYDQWSADPKDKYKR